MRVNPIDQDYVIDLAMQYEDGVKLPPIKVTKDGIIVDGRHRFHAMMMAEFEDCAVQIISGSKSDLLLEAMCSNVGSKPMTSKDVQYVIGQLMDQGMKELQIINNLRDRCGYTSKWCAAFTRSPSHGKRWPTIVSRGESYRDGDITETDMFDSARRGTRTEDVLLQQAAIA